MVSPAKAKLPIKGKQLVKEVIQAASLICVPNHHSTRQPKAIPNNQCFFSHFQGV